MKIRRSCFTRIFVSLMFLTQLILGIPSLGFAATPHPCNTNVTPRVHLGGTSPYHLGNVGAPYTFTFATACPDSSYVTAWSFSVKDVATNKILCSKTNGTLPTDSLSCPTITPVMVVTITYNGTLMGMNHPDTFYVP